VWAQLVPLFLALLKLTGSLSAFLRERQLISAGQAQAAYELLKEQTDAMRIASQIRNDVSAGIDADPSKLRDDDDFKRRDKS
jgi:hypothetical protein